MTDNVEFECRDSTAWITFNRPETKNALTGEMMERLLVILNGLADDRNVRVVVVRGKGSDFCSGADVGGLSALLATPAAERTASFHKSLDTRIHPLVHAFQRLSQPIVASVRGYAIGIGVQFALLSDLVIASESAQFILPQVKLAHTLDHGESYLLPRRIGLSKAMQLSLLGESLNAVDAERFGLANWVTSDDALEQETQKVVTRLLRGAPDSVRRTKALLNASQNNSLEEQLQAERYHVGFGAGSENFIEALNAYNQKRAPSFSDV